VPGYFPGGGDGPEVLSTAPVKERLMGQGGISSARSARVQDTLSTERVAMFDLGGKTVHVMPRDGHTPSDVTVEVMDPAVVFGGDLIWNRLFPNYVHATPSRLNRAVDSIMSEGERVLVPGHGPIPTWDEAKQYRELLGRVEDAAKRGHEAGHSAAEAAAGFSIPDSLGEWTFFSDRYVEVAVGAWYKELGD
jgi:glyoxylase-like metal-dependent hydrolase (beta-lactamase superfamily II)